MQIKYISNVRNYFWQWFELLGKWAEGGGGGLGWPAEEIYNINNWGGSMLQLSILLTIHLRNTGSFNWKVDIHIFLAL
jgi:hypothetical protein